MNNFNRIITLNIDLLVNLLKNYDDVVQQLKINDIITQEMIDSIESTCTTDPDKKRELFTLLPKRGPNLETKLKDIFYLTGNRDLVYILNGMRLMNQCEVAVDGSDEEVEQIYELRNSSKGRVGIFNFYSFVNDLTNNERRDGSREDVAHLKTFWESLGYLVHTEEDLDGESFRTKLVEFIDDRDFVEDSCILFIMSHGQNKCGTVDIKMHDNTYVNSEWVLSKLNSSAAPHLAKKPKLLFVTTCRGIVGDVGVNIIAAEKRRRQNHISTDGKPTDFYPLFANILVVFPCTEGTTTTRDIKYGSHFIQILLHVFNTKGDSEDLLTMLNEVDRTVIENSLALHLNNNQFHHFQVVCCKKIGFNKKFYLNGRRLR